MKRRILSCTCAGVLLALGCANNVPEDNSTSPAVDAFTPGSTGSPGSGIPSVNSPTMAPTSPIPDFPSGEQLPTDTRAPVTADTPPPPISGGTLLVASDGLTAVAADPDRDRIVFVDVPSATVLSELALEPGDEPGRLVEDSEGRIHVALRGAGQLATIDLATRSLSGRRDVCAAPRGVAYERGGDMVHVACIDGELLSLPASGGDMIRKRDLGRDIRDVVVTGAGLRVTRFKSAQVLELDEAGDVADMRAMRVTRQRRQTPDGQLQSQSFSPALARRAVALSNDSVLVLHERELDDTIALQDPHDPMANQASSFDVPGGVAEGSAYGGVGSCSSIVQSALSMVDADGKVTHSMSLAGVVLPVDVAVTSDGRTVAVADAGGADLSAPQRNAFFSKDQGAGVTLFSMSQNMLDTDDLGEGYMQGQSFGVQGQPTAVAFTPDGTLVMQSRQPAQLMLHNKDGDRTIDLGGADRIDTGHEIFHRNAGAGIACASCHGEGGDDGHVWNFSTLGPRRTQSLNVGLEGTAPFHWSGDMADLNMLVREVFVGRMGGVPQSDARVDALSKWLFAQTAPAAPRAQNDESAVRGKSLFESKEVGCTGCHEGQKLTNNQTVDVGTGEPMQVPSLIGVAYRAPFIHTGCAATLRDRFDPSCGGGDKHGHTSQLDDDQINDLVAYLETL
jgi:mono/diheme cytochrome c family protein